LRIVAEHGYDAIVVTNQQGVGKRLYSEETLDAVHTKLLRCVKAVGLDILAIYYCPHLAEEKCECRKPKSGMILQATNDWQIDLAASWMVGDSLRDVDAGASAGCRTVLVGNRAYERATVSIGQIEDLPSTLENLLEEGCR
jgi:D-glycero-D-manno-heptose 1,7-bisphosphate phosphatase